MSNVIHVEFGKKNAISQQGASLSEPDPSLTAYLDSLREEGIDEDDVLDMLDAINDLDAYLAADEVVQELADGWLHQFL